MNSFKEKATGKLSRLFSDSPSPRSPRLPHSPARPHPEDSKLSSILSRILPSSIFGKSKSRNNTNDINPILSSPIKRENGNVLWQDLPSDSYGECYDHEYEDKDAPNTRREDHEHGLENGDMSSSSDSFEDAVDHHSLKSMSDLTEESSLISYDLYEFLLSCLPNIVKGCQWFLLYSTAKHGISLCTLIRRSADLPGPCFLIVGDKQGAVLGGLLECPLQPTPKRKYQGTNKTFVFTTKYGEPRLFRPTGSNRYYCMCMNDLLGLGGGDAWHYA